MQFFIPSQSHQGQSLLLFSKLPLLPDKNNTGLILNAVHSRDNCFLYLKEIVKGEYYVVLSQEEVEDLRKAVNFGLGEIEKE